MMETAAYNTNNPTYNSNQTPPQSAISENQTVKRNGGVPNIENHHVTYEPELPPPDEIKPDLEIRRRSSTINDTVRKSSGTGDDMIIPVESSQTSIKEETIPDSDKCDLIQSTGSKGWSKLRTTVKATSVVTEPVKKKRRQSNLQRQDSFLKRFSTRQGVSNDDDDDTHNDEKRATKVSSNGVQFEHRHSVVIHPVENVMFVWLAIITCAVLYNCWSIILRQAFPDIQSASSMAWFISDGLCDFIYICDIVVQLRTGFLEKGLLVYDSKKLALHYIKSQPFILDLVCLIPLDVIQFGIGIMPILRIPRLIKAYRWWRWKNMVESRTMYPNMWRVVNLTHMLFLLCHWFAGFYFLISTAEGFQGDWAYPTPVGEYANPIRKYLKSMYWATLTLTTIGDLPPPDTNWEYVFTIVSYLIGVFFFATIVGQVGNVITNRNANRLEFERLLDGAKNYMRNHNVPGDMQRRVQRWYDYAWSRGRVNGGGGDINSLGLLPDKLKTELALHVNLSTLKKVTIFQECQPEFLHDLVLKMRAYIFTPGDLVCRKGEVAREMFIIADGILEVISDTGEVLTQMGAGDFFGEIGILNLDGGVNRRTADVRSVGYSELFTLSREDVLNALTDHPEAEVLIKEYGRRRLKEMADRKRIRTQSKCGEDRLLQGFRVEPVARSRSDSRLNIWNRMFRPLSKPRSASVELPRETKYAETSRKFSVFSTFSDRKFSLLSCSSFNSDRKFSAYSTTADLGIANRESLTGIDELPPIYHPPPKTPWYKLAQFGLRRLLPSNRKKHGGKKYQAVEQKEKVDGSKIQIKIDLCSDEESDPSVSASMDSVTVNGARVLLNLRPPDALMPTDEAEEDEAEAAQACVSGGDSKSSNTTAQTCSTMQPTASNRITQGGINLDQDLCNPAGHTQQWLSAQQFHVKPHDTEQEFTGERRVSISDSSLYYNRDKRGSLPGSRRVSISKSVRSIRDKVDDDDNGIELRALGDKRDDRVRLNRSETKETQLTVPKKSFVHPSSSSSREDIVSEIMSEFKGVLISKLKSTDSHLVKKVNDLETLNTSQAQRIRELELKIEALQRLVTAISTCEYIDASPPSSNSYEPEHSDDQSHNAAATRTRIQVTRI
ncbi:cyclic nucleotide-gated olfactory channel-like isoform X2 [Lineus longissimus]|uniref:cyclic nucleotide-gated olfactory channel-like isoform X2 n=1 Tax=Lineus longissimus TaxID=88925 RepID=UPI00315C570B